MCNDFNGREYANALRRRTAVFVVGFPVLLSALGPCAEPACAVGIIVGHAVGNRPQSAFFFARLVQSSASAAKVAVVHRAMHARARRVSIQTPSSRVEPF
jgi:hypothetical protein